MSQIGTKIMIRTGGGVLALESTGNDPGHEVETKGQDQEAGISMIARDRGPGPLEIGKRHGL